MSSQFSLSGQETFYTTALQVGNEKGEAGSCTLDWSTQYSEDLPLVTTNPEQIQHCSYQIT